MFYLILTLRSQFLEDLRETFCRRALGYLKPARLEKTTRKSFSLQKRLTMVDLFEGLWSVGTRFRR